MSTNFNRLFLSKKEANAIAGTFRRSFECRSMVSKSEQREITIVAPSEVIFVLESDKTDKEDNAGRARDRRSAQQSSKA